jgi:MFS family permease
MPLLWVVSGNYWYLLVVQAVSGFAWAGFSLSASNFLYDLIARDKRATYLAIHHVLASIGIFAGAMLGGFLGTHLPTSLEIFGQTLAWASPLLGVFVISGLVRALIVLMLVPKVREVRNVRSISVTDLIFRVTRVNALAGLFFDVVGSRSKAPRGSKGGE